MLLNEIKYVIFFDYIKDIRRYLYDIEVFFKEQDLFSGIVGTNQISDEADPFLSRLHIVKEVDDKRINIIVSQISVTIVAQYKNNFSLENLDAEQKKFHDIIINSRKYLKSSIENFNICFESLSVVSSKMYSDSSDITLVNVDTSQDENRNITSTEEGNELFLIEDTSVYKTYKQTENIVHPILIKNKVENFMGWNLVLRKEINNRLQYNNSVDFDGELNFDRAIKLLKISLLEVK